VYTYNTTGSLNVGSFSGTYSSDYTGSAPVIALCNGACTGGEWTSTAVDLETFLSSQGAASETYATRFNSASFSSTTATVSYYTDINDFTGQYDRPDVIMVSIGSDDNPNVENAQKIILPLSTGNATTTLTFTTPLADGTYTAFVNFWNMTTSKLVFNRANITMKIVVSGGVVTSATVAQQSNGLLPASSDYYEDCGLTAWSGCLSNSIRFLFYPSTASVDTFLQTYTTMQTKIPFVYVYQASTLLTSLYSGSASTIPTISVTTPIGDITFISQAQVAALPFVSLLRSLIAAGLWIMLFVVLYRKTITIHDNKATA